MTRLADSNPSKRQDEIEARIARIEEAISTMAWWLTQTPDSFGEIDARGIDAILKGEKKKPA